MILKKDKKKSRHVQMSTKGLRSRSYSIISSLGWKGEITLGRKWVGHSSNNQLFVMEIHQKGVWAGAKTASLLWLFQKTDRRFS